MNKVVKQEKAFSVYDLENEKFVDVSLEQQRTAAYLHQQILLGAFVSAQAIKKIFDERLYIALGCQSQIEYINTMLPFTERQCYRLVAVARKIESISNSFSDNKLLPEGSSENSELLTSMSVDVNSLGSTKLYELSKISDEEFEKLIKKGKIHLDGKEVSLDDLKDMTAKEIAQQIKKATAKYQEKLKKIETDNIQLTEQNKLLESEKKHLLDENKNAKEIEAVYGPTATTIKHKKQLLELARGYLNNFDGAVINAAIAEEDPQGIQKDLVDIIAKVDEVYQRLIDVYGVITTRF